LGREGWSGLAGRAPADDEAWVALGSNLGDRQAALQGAIAALGEAVVLCSPLLETAPWGPVPQPPFLNGVLRLRWTDGPRALLTRCLHIEAASGRVRRERWGPRTLDLDVLVVGHLRCADADLRLPHPGIAERSFVLDPWRRVAPELRIPGLERTVGDLWSALEGRS
jgi:2-amino-4-hydroxy-6-hydroxymethyldihydropteridine diphosphokinase